MYRPLFTNLITLLTNFPNTFISLDIIVYSNRPSKAASPAIPPAIPPTTPPTTPPTPPNAAVPTKPNVPPSAIPPNIADVFDAKLLEGLLDVAVSYAEIPNPSTPSPRPIRPKLAALRSTAEFVRFAVAPDPGGGANPGLLSCIIDLTSIGVRLRAFAFARDLCEFSFPGTPRPSLPTSLLYPCLAASSPACAAVIAGKVAGSEGRASRAMFISGI